jgi:hypothetical protein
MRRKSVAKINFTEPAKQETPVVLPPKTEVKEEAKRMDDGKTTNELVVQKVSVPFVSKYKGTTSTTFKDYLRIFVRPDESHDEPDARWDEHEPEDEVALKQLFATYGKGSGTTLSIRLDIDGTGKEEFFLDVRHPKPEGDEDERLPSVLVDTNDATTIDNIFLDLFYEMSGEDPPDDFKTRSKLEEELEEYSPLEDDREAIENLLSEFDMPVDLPANLYSLSDRLRSIFRTAKGLT